MTFPQTVHIFCHVIDNFGDIGVCWRLSRQIVREHGIDVTLWVDDLNSLKKICSRLELSKDQQSIQNVDIRKWPDHSFVFAPDDVADAVVEAFGCELPPSYIEAMAQRKRTPAWINLEYLSAEAWVENCHALPSPHTLLPLTIYFFFPGFTGKTGGLPLERDLFTRRDAFQRDPGEVAAFFSGLGVRVPADTCKVSLFCYPFVQVSALLNAMQADTRPVLCLVPEGVASAAISTFLQQPAMLGAAATHGSLTVQVIPFVEQDDYDRLLWACDINFVRGEDSFVRAQWAERPFVWQIYRQDEEVHQNKLEAFLGLYTGSMSANVFNAATGIFRAWNDTVVNSPSMHEYWRNFRSASVQLAQHARGWTQEISLHGDLASNMLQFIRKIG